MNFILLFGALLGLSSVMMAAYVDHTLSLLLTGKSLNSILTALRYHQLYAIVICMLGLTQTLSLNTSLQSWLNRAAYVFATGVSLFSFSIYLTMIFNIAMIIYFVPVGGLLIMTGWICLMFAALHSSGKVRI